MGGFSIMIILGIMMSIFYFFLAIIVLIAIYMLITYIFESISLQAFSKNLKYKYPILAWLPFYNKYILGKISGTYRLGILLSVSSLITFILGIYIFEGGTFGYIFIIFFVLLLLNFILDLVITHKIFKKYIIKYSDILTVFSVLSLGFLRPIFMFIIRNRKEEQKN